MYVVLDSNVWIAEMGLNSGLGAATRFFIGQQAATIAIPEVVRLETEAHLRANLISHIEAISTNYSKILSVFGKLKEIVLPEDEAVEAIVADVFQNLGVPVDEIPFSLDSATNSFNKIINKSPPSQKSQQFKDGVIWANCLGLLDSADVHLVTQDKAFYKGMDLKQGLDHQLLAEASKKPHHLHIYPELTGLLQSIRIDVDIDHDLLLAAFLEQNQGSVDRMLARFSFSFLEKYSFSILPFATGDPNALHIEFEYEIRCVPLEADGHSDGVLSLKGDATYNPQTGKFSNVRNFGEKFTYTSADGTEETGANHALFANSIVIGHREVERSVRHPL